MQQDLKQTLLDALNISIGIGPNDFDSNVFVERYDDINITNDNNGVFEGTCTVDLMGDGIYNRPNNEESAEANIKFRYSNGVAEVLEIEEILE